MHAHPMYLVYFLKMFMVRGSCICTHITRTRTRKKDLWVVCVSYLCVCLYVVLAYIHTKNTRTHITSSMCVSYVCVCVCLYVVCVPCYGYADIHVCMHAFTKPSRVGIYVCIYLAHTHSMCTYSCKHIHIDIRFMGCVCVHTRMHYLY
jgi:hypothetical protein